MTSTTFANPVLKIQGDMSWQEYKVHHLTLWSEGEFSITRSKHNTFRLLLTVSSFFLTLREVFSYLSILFPALATRISFVNCRL